MQQVITLEKYRSIPCKILLLPRNRGTHGWIGQGCSQRCQCIFKVRLSDCPFGDFPVLFSVQGFQNTRSAIRPVELKDFCFTFLLNMKQVGLFIAAVKF